MQNAYRNAIRDLIDLLRRRGAAQQIIRYQIGSDEVKDPTLVSLRAYGSREHAAVVMVACGTSGIWEELPQIEVILPTLLQIRQLKRDYGVA